MTGPLDMVARLAGRWDLTMDLTRRELVGRYKGSVLGILWSLIQPLFLLAIYTTVFGIIIPIWGKDASIADFAIFLFTGMITWNLMSEALGGACQLIYMRPTFVKKVVFPLEILAVVQVCVAVVHFLFAFTILLLAVMIFAEVHWTMLWLPVVIVPLAFFTLGLTWILAALGVYMRDLAETVGVILMAGMFLTPIFYKMDQVPEAFRLVLLVNPVTWFVVEMRHIVTDGIPPHTLGLLVVWPLSFVVAWIGYAFFQRTRPGFGDVL